MNEIEIFYLLKDITNSLEIESSIFITNRIRLNAGIYEANFVIRTKMQKSYELTKKIMELFINGKEIKFIKSELTITEANGRFEDFYLSAEIIR